MAEPATPSCAVVVEADLAVGLGGLLALLGGVGLEPHQGGVDEPGQVGHDPVLRAGDGGLGVDERDRLGAEVGGVLGDLAGLPRLQPPGLHQSPEPGEAILQLEGVRDQVAARAVGDVEGGGELLDRPLGDPRCAFAGEVVA